MTEQPKIKLSVEQYLEIDRKSQHRHEFYNGEMFDMSEASRKHNIVIKNLMISLENFLSGKKCNPFMIDVRLNLNNSGNYAYPDILVVCGDDAFSEEDIVDDATLIIEVLSPSTEAFDRGTKFQYYQNLKSINEYVLVSQDKMLIEVFEKESDNHWNYIKISEPKELLTLKSIQFSVQLSEIYKSIVF